MPTVHVEDHRAIDRGCHWLRIRFPWRCHRPHQQVKWRRHGLEHGGIPVDDPGSTESKVSAAVPADTPKRATTALQGFAQASVNFDWSTKRIGVTPYPVLRAPMLRNIGGNYFNVANHCFNFRWAPQCCATLGAISPMLQNIGSIFFNVEK